MLWRWLQRYYFSYVRCEKMKNKVVTFLEGVEEFVASFFFIGGSIISLYGVFMRYIVNSPKAWTTEIFETFMVFAIFIGFGMALKDNQHIAVDLLYDKLPSKAKKIVDIIATTLGLGFSIFLTVMGIEMVSVAHSQGGITIDVGIPVWITYIAMPLGMGLLAFYFLLKLINIFRNWNKVEEVQEIDIEELF